MSWKDHPGKILRRCVVCGKFHASYLVQDAGPVQGYYCYRCWKARHDTPPVPDEDREQTGTQKRGR